MVFYLCNLTLICFFSYVLKRCKQENIMFVVMFIWLAILGALRGNGVGLDYNNYKDFFQLVANNKLSRVIKSSDPGYVVINKIIGIFTDNFQWLLAVSSFLSFAGVVYFIRKYSHYPVISLWIYITMGSFQATFTTIRQAIAISIVLIAYNFAIKKKLIKFAVLIIAAASFHYSAIIAAVMYFFINKPTKKENIVISFLLVVGLIVARPQLNALFMYIVSFTKYGFYIGTTSGEGGALLCLFLIILVYLVVCVFFTHKDIHILYWFDIFSCLIQGYALSIATVTRLGAYFSVPMYILLPNTIDCFDALTKKVAGVVLMAVTLGFYIYCLANPGISYTMQYTFFF